MSVTISQVFARSSDGEKMRYTVVRDPLMPTLSVAASTSAALQVWIVAVRAARAVWNEL